MKKQDLSLEEIDSYYQRYIDKLEIETDLIQGFIAGKKNTVTFFRSIPEEKLSFRYRPEKWTIKEILQHIIDTERIFMYRCFRIARRDNTPLKGYEQDNYIQPSKANSKPLEDLLKEFIMNRNNSIALLESFTAEDLCYKGIASDCIMSARAAAFTVIGHDIWHKEVIKQKYL